MPLKAGTKSAGLQARMIAGAPTTPRMTARKGKVSGRKSAPSSEITGMTKAFPEFASASKSMQIEQANAPGIAGIEYNQSGFTLISKLMCLFFVPLEAGTNTSLDFFLKGGSPQMNTSMTELLRKLIDVEKAIGVESNYVLRRKMHEAEDYALELQKDIAESLHDTAKRLSHPGMEARAWTSSP
jgi:hypothetical protein